MASAETIIEKVRNLARADSGTDVPVLSDDFLFEAIMDGQTKWEDAFQIGGENPIADQLETGFDLVAETTLNETSGITDADTSITVDDANDYDSANGAVIIWDDNIPDFLSYTTWTSGTKTFSGVTGIAFDHEDEDRLAKLYKLPTNFGSFRESPLYGDGVRLNGVPMRYIDTVPPDGYFSLYDNGTNKFLVLPRGLTGSASVLFNKSSATIDSTDDTVSVPDRFKFFLIFHCLAYAYQGRENAVDKFQFAQAESEKILMRALQNRSTGKKIRTRPFAGRAGDSVTVGNYTYPVYFG